MERTHSTKLLGVIIHEHLKWNDHVNELLKSSYSTLHALKHLKRLADFKLRKILAESLLLSKIDYAITIYGNNLPKLLSKRIQKLMNSCAGFVLNKYAKESDLISLKWLPFEELFFHLPNLHLSYFMMLVNRITLVFSLKSLKENSVVITTINLQLRLEHTTKTLIPL